MAYKQIPNGTAGTVITDHEGQKEIAEALARAGCKNLDDMPAIVELTKNRSDKVRMFLAMNTNNTVILEMMFYRDSKVEVRAAAAQRLAKIIPPRNDSVKPRT